MSDGRKPEPDRAHEAKTRLCLMCRGEFTSSWPGERVCGPCKQTRDWQRGDDAIGDTGGRVQMGGES